MVVYARNLSTPAFSADFLPDSGRKWYYGAPGTAGLLFSGMPVLLGGELFTV